MTTLIIKNRQEATEVIRNLNTRVACILEDSSSNLRSETNLNKIIRGYTQSIQVIHQSRSDVHKSRAPDYPVDSSLYGGS